MREPARPCLSVPRLHLNQNWIVNHLSWACFLPLLRALECNCSCSVHNQQPRSRCFCRQPTRELLFLSSHSKVRFFLSAGAYTKASLIGREFVSPEKLVRWRLLQMHPFFYSSNSNTPKRRNSASPYARIWKHFLPVSVACVSHFFSLSSLFFFFYIHTF